MSKNYLIIDGGATKTIVSLRDENNNSLAEIEGTGSNFQVIGLHVFSQVIERLVTEILTIQEVEEIDVILFALAGIDSQEDQTIVYETVTKIITKINLEYNKIVVENDAYSTLLGLTQKEPGVLVISGTGSIAYAHNGEGKATRAGGWGHRSGDDGSGYWIGREILKAVYRMEDGRNIPTLLKELVFNYLNISTIEELSKWNYGESYSVDKVAHLSHLLPLALEKNDQIATDIFHIASCELVALAQAVIKSANIHNSPFCIYFNGGTICNFEELYNDIKREIEIKFPGKSVELCTNTPIESIFLRAKGLSNE